jgi:hypothetical protein
LVFLFLSQALLAFITEHAHLFTAAEWVNTQILVVNTLLWNDIDIIFPQVRQTSKCSGPWEGDSSWRTWPSVWNIILVVCSNFYARVHFGQLGCSRQLDFWKMMMQQADADVWFYHKFQLIRPLLVERWFDSALDDGNDIHPTPPFVCNVIINMMMTILVDASFLLVSLILRL